jgi:hypothetical protein
MATYTHTQLYGSGSIGETCSGVEKTFNLITQVVPHILLWKLYPNPLVFMRPLPLKTLVEPHTQWVLILNGPSYFLIYSQCSCTTRSFLTFTFTPAITVTGTTYRLKGTGMYSLEIS